jgi:hypothetical protein
MDETIIVVDNAFDILSEKELRMEFPVLVFETKKST